MEDNKFRSKGMLIGIWLPFIFCLLLGVLDVLVYYSHNIDSSNAQVYMTMASPFIFVCCMFMAFRTKIIEQDDKIKELEEKINKVV